MQGYDSTPSRSTARAPGTKAQAPLRPAPAPVRKPKGLIRRVMDR